MDKLRYIDELLKTSLGDSGYATSVSSDDWLAIEKRLKRRKNRIYAMWFSLSLVVLTSIGLWIANVQQSQPITEITPVEIKQEKIIKETPTENPNQTPESALEINTETPINSGTPNEVRNVLSIENETPIQEIAVEELPENQTSDELDVIEGNTDAEPFETDGLVNEEIEANNFVNDIIEKPAIALANTSNQPKIKGGISHMEFGVSVTPSFASKFLAEDSKLGGLINKNFFGIVDNSEQAAFATNTHFNAAMHFNSGVYLGFGIGYVQRTEQINYNYVIDHFVDVDLTENKIVDYTELPPIAWQTVNYQGSNSYHFVDIPVRVGYRYNVLPKWSVGHELSLSYMLLIKQVGQRADVTDLNLYDIGEADFYNKANLGSSFKTGLYYNFKNFVIGAEPVAGMNLNSLSNDQSALKIRPYNYGFNLTTQIKIGRN
ncbi:MAG: hypothetical protein JXR19_11620 [Bacteroidia bacterium]